MLKPQDIGKEFLEGWNTGTEKGSKFWAKKQVLARVGIFRQSRYSSLIGHIQVPVGKQVSFSMSSVHLPC